MFCEVPVGGGPSSPLYSWLALTVRNSKRSAPPGLRKFKSIRWRSACARPPARFAANFSCRCNSAAGAGSNGG